jgi:hypothetical protein
MILKILQKLNGRTSTDKHVLMQMMQTYLCYQAPRRLDIKYHTFTSTPDWDNGHSTFHLLHTHGMSPQYPLDGRPGRPYDQCEHYGGGEKIFSLLGIKSQSVASPITDCTILAL